MICLSFDTEEFDVPREYGVKYDTIKEDILVSQYGIDHILQTLDEESVKATFFCKSNFVLNTTDLVRRIQREGHEIASHGCDHWKPKSDNAKLSKRIIEDYFPLNLYVWMKNLLPQRLILIPSWKSHCSRIDNGIFCEQSHDILRECVRRVYAVEPVGDVTKMRIGFVGWKQLFSVSHKRINKKWPALVRCIPCGREAMAGSIECKGTSFNRNFQMFWRKSA